MSEEMAVSDNTTGEEDRLTSDETAATITAEPEEVAPEQHIEPAVVDTVEPPALADSPPPEVDPEEQGEPAEPIQVKAELHDEELDIAAAEPIKEELDEEVTFKEEIEETVVAEENGDDNRGIKRRASTAFSDNGDEDTVFKGFEDVKKEVDDDKEEMEDVKEEKEDINLDMKTGYNVKDEEFKGFDDIKEEILTNDYNRILERLQAEVTAATKAFVPLKTVMATPPLPTRPTKRSRKDTDGSRPSSALSSRSEGDGSTDASSPASRGGRRPTTEMSSPLLRIPLERGWKRELVYRAALDPNSKRNGDIYYYTPQGKKLRSTREVGEHLAGTGLTLENFSFFKEPLGVDDPEKEIIRDAKLMRRLESPVAAITPVAPVEGKRTPKPKMPKGASPEPQNNVAQAAAALKSPTAKLKVKSVGARLSTSTPAHAPVTALKEKQQQQQKKPPPPVPPTPDNNNTASWKKPRYRIMYNYTDLQEILSLGFD